MTSSFEKKPERTEPELVEVNILLNEGRSPESFPEGTEGEVRDGFSFYMWREDKENPEKSGWEFITSKIKEGDEDMPTLHAVDKKQFSAWGNGEIKALPAVFVWNENKNTWNIGPQKTEGFKEYGEYEHIIFLDIQGVLLNSEGPFDRKAVRALHDIVEHHSAKLVISSTWRFNSLWYERILKLFMQAGWDNPPIIDRAPLITDGEALHGKGIQEWLDTHPTNSYIILDDDDMFRKFDDQELHFVQCDIKKGLGKEQVDEVDRMWPQKKSDE